MLTSYLKSVAAGPQQLQLNVKKAKHGQSGGKKRLLHFFNKVHLLRPCFDVFKLPKRGRSKVTKKTHNKTDFRQSGNENGG
jgi:hypothetical protein